MAEKLFSKVSVIPSQLQADIELTKKMKLRCSYVKADWRTGLIRSAKTALRRMGRVANAFPEGSSVHSMYTTDRVLLERDMTELFGEHWRCP